MEKEGNKSEQERKEDRKVKGQACAVSIPIRTSFMQNIITSLHGAVVVLKALGSVGSPTTN